MLRKLYMWSFTKLAAWFRSPNSVEQPDHLHKRIPYSEPISPLQEPYRPATPIGALTRWQEGDRLAVEEINAEDVRDHPDRARLALALGSAHQQLGNLDTAKNFIQWARKWGCDRKTIAQVLIADTYKTLGRAAALSRANRCELQHTTPLTSGQNTAIPSNAESCKTTGAEAKHAESAKMMPRLNDDALLGIVKKMDQLLATQERKVHALGLELKQQIRSASEQVEALLRIQTYLVSGNLLPSFHGWPVSPDFACLLIQKIEREHYNLVIEFGSGTSTVLISNVLDRLDGKGQQTYQIAFEHLEKYYAETTNSLAACKTTRHHANLVLAPLVNAIEDQQNGDIYKFYDCHSHLAALAQHDSLTFAKLLVIVDGPPGATGPHARYPALPVVLAAFPHAEIDFVLDDTNRKDEQEIVIMWIKALEERGHIYEQTTHDFEKGAVVLKIKPR